MEQAGSLTPILMEGLIYIALFVFTIYTLIYGYHWFAYGTNKRTSLIALAVFLIGAGLLLGAMFISWLYVA